MGGGVAVDREGHAYVTGQTWSRTFGPTFPTTPGAYDRTNNGSADSFVTKLSPDGSALAYSTFLGGASEEVGYGIAVHAALPSAVHVYVTGRTSSPDFPTTPGAFDRSYNGSPYDVFVSKFVIGD